MSSTTGTLPIASPDVIPTDPSPQIRLILEWTKAANALDLEKIFSFVSDDGYTQYLLPERSIAAAGHPTVYHNKEEFKKGLTGFFSMFKTPGVVLHEVIESGNKVVAHGKANGTTKTDHPFITEYNFIFTFGTDSNGDLKIVKTKEFIDALYISELMPAEMERMKKAGASEK